MQKRHERHHVAYAGAIQMDIIKKLTLLLILLEEGRAKWTSKLKTAHISQILMN